MNFPESKVCLTAHWADEIFKPQKVSKKEIAGIDDHRPIMLYAGRISKEKGVMELPVIYRKIKKAHPDVALLVVGQGPALEQLKEALPEGYFIDWVTREQLPAIYSAADVLVFPSKFDTFSCVVLESISCGLPVVAYNSKGPKDIIKDGVCGYLVKTEEKLCEKIISFLKKPQQQKEFKKAAVKRAENYNVDSILKKFVADIG